MRTWLCFVAVLAIAGCKKEEPTRPQPGSATVTGSGSGSGSAGATVTAGSVAIFVDDAEVAKVTPAQLASWPRLDSLVPEDLRRLGTWTSVSLVTTKPAPAEIQRPSANYPDMVPVLYPNDGAVSFGMFDAVELAKKGKPGMREDNVREVRIKVSKEGRGGEHQGGGGEAVDPANLKLTFKLPDGKEAVLSGAQILELPRESQPGAPDTKGWRLTALLDAAGVKTYAKVILIDAGGISLPFEKKELADSTHVAFVKLNKAGTLRFRMLQKEGAGWKAAGDLRALTTVQVK